MHGGTIPGQVTIEGGQPRPMAFNLATIPDAVYCGRIFTGTGWRFVEDFITGPDKALKDVVVMLKNASKLNPLGHTGRLACVRTGESYFPKAA